MSEKFSFEVFTNLATKSIQKAEDYRDRCHGREKVAPITPVEEVIDTILPKKEESVVEVKETPIEEEIAEIDVLRLEYKSKFGKNPSSKMKVESLRAKLK